MVSFVREGFMMKMQFMSVRNMFTREDSLTDCGMVKEY